MGITMREGDGGVVVGEVGDIGHNSASEGRILVEVRRPESSESRLTGRVCDPSPVTLHGLERRDGILSAFCLQFLRDFRDGVGLLSSIRGRFVREGLSSFTGDVGDDEEEEGTEEGDSGELVAE